MFGGPPLWMPLASFPSSLRPERVERAGKKGETENQRPGGVVTKKKATPEISGVAFIKITL